MSTKRRQPHDEGLEGVHPLRKAQMDVGDDRPVKKPFKNFPNKAPLHERQAHASSVNLLKKKIRDVTRRLERADLLPANVKADDERALEAYNQELAAAEQEGIRQTMIKRYHMVRFFERQKATRSIKRLRKALIEATSETEVARLTKDLHTADVDMHYAQYCPLNQVYIGIYPKTAPPEDYYDRTKKPELWFEVEKRMEEGGLDGLRDGVRMTIGFRPKPKSKPSGANAATKSSARPVSKIRTAEPSSDSNKNTSTETSRPKQITKPASSRMTDEEYFRLNRREKRKEDRKAGGFSTSRAPKKEAGIVPNNDSMDVDDGGGFFEE